MESRFAFSRRQLLKGLSSAALLSGAHSFFPVRGRAESPREKLFQFRYADVKLTGGPLKAQFDRIHAAYLRLDEDRLLKEFRMRAGLPAPGEEMGGWYGRDGFAPGHSLGQYISGLARFAEATGDAATRAKVMRLVEGFDATIAPDGYCYMSQKASTNFPAYTYDKYVIGLLDAHQFAGVSSALSVLDRATRGAVKYMPPRAIDRNLEPLKHAPDDESYTLAENLFYAYEVSGNSDYLEMAKKYLLNSTYFEPLSRDENVLPHRHAYSHTNALSSAARAYLVLGERKHLAAIQNAWEMLERTQQYASGGWGPDESFVEPHRGRLGESLTETHAHFETPCGAYAHFKLARYLLRFTGEAGYGDGLERVLYNTVLGAKDPSGDGHFFYYSDYHPSTEKDYHPNQWPCCSGTLPQAVADYLISAYFQSPEGLYVNLFVPSELRWKAQDMPAKLIQSTDYPESGSIELRLELPAPADFTVHLRIPGWLESAAELSVNGREISVPAEPRTFAAIRRRWQNHDTIQVRLPLTFRTEAIDEQHPSTIALMRGPVMLVAISPEMKLSKKAITAPDGMKQGFGSPPSFELTMPPDKLRFLPFYAVDAERYTTYFVET